MVQTYDVDHDKDWDNALKMGDLNEPGVYCTYLLRKTKLLPFMYT